MDGPHLNQLYDISVLGCRQKMKKILPPLFRSGSTQRSIWRPFFDPPIPFSLATRAFYAAPLAAPSWTPLFGLFWLPCQKYDLELDFLADFHIFCRELPHVSRNASRFEIARIKKKLRPPEDKSFYRFLTTHTWETLFTLSPENLAGLGGFGQIFDIFSQKRPWKT